MLNDRISFFSKNTRQLGAGRFRLISDKGFSQTFHFEAVNGTFELELSEARVHSRIFKKYNLTGTLWGGLLKASSAQFDAFTKQEFLFWSDERLFNTSQLEGHLEEITQIEIASKLFSIEDKNLLTSAIADILNLTELFFISACESLKIDEGEEYLVLQKKYERSPLLRKIAIQQHGVSCIICGFNFEMAYGSLGSGFIHIHHIDRLADTGKRSIDPRTDLVPVCPNCHAMLHAKTPPLRPAELKETIEGKKND
jgi:hypothetical protein